MILRRKSAGMSPLSMLQNIGQVPAEVIISVTQSVLARVLYDSVDMSSTGAIASSMFSVSTRELSP